MSRRLLLAALLTLALAPAGWAQTEPDHTFQIRNGQVYFDGLLVPDAVPADLDLTGVATDLLEMYGDVIPVLEVDGTAYVFEGGRLIRFGQSSRAGRKGLYVMPSLEAGVSGVASEQITPVAEAAYLREVEARNEELYNRMRREHQMEVEAYALAERIQGLPDGPDRRRLVEELRGRLSDLLTMKQEILAEEILFMQARLDGLRARLAERDDRHDDIVEQRLRQLVGAE